MTKGLGEIDGWTVGFMEIGLLLQAAAHKTRRIGRLAAKTDLNVIYRIPLFGFISSPKPDNS